MEVDLDEVAGILFENILPGGVGQFEPLLSRAAN